METILGLIAGSAVLTLVTVLGLKGWLNNRSKREKQADH